MVKYSIFLAYTVVFLARLGETFHLRIELILAVVLIVLVISDSNMIKRLKNAMKTSEGKAFLGFLFAILLSIPTSYYPTKSIFCLLDFMKYTVFAVMVVAFLTTHLRIKAFLWVYSLCMAYVAFPPFLEHLAGSGVYQGVHRVFGALTFYKNPNVLGITLVQTLPFVYYLFFSQKPKARFICRGALIAMGGLFIAVTIFTGSRGAFISIVVLILGTWWILSKNKVLGLLVMIVFCICLFVLMPEEYRQRQGTIVEMSADDKTFQGRIDNVKNALVMLSKHPINGVGVGCFQNANWRLFQNHYWAHNLFAELAGELGLVGLITWSLFIILLFKKTTMIRKSLIKYGDENNHLLLANVLKLSLVVQLANGISQHVLYLFLIYVVAALIFAVDLLVKERLGKEEHDQVAIKQIGE